MKRTILLLLVILSTTSIALATDVSVTANLITQTSSKLTYSIDITEVKIASFDAVELFIYHETSRGSQRADTLWVGADPRCRRAGGASPRATI